MDTCFEINRRLLMQGGAALSLSLLAGMRTPAAAKEKISMSDRFAPDYEAMVPTSGGRIYLRVNGEIGKGKVPLLMIHGGPGYSHVGFLPALEFADGRPVILYDQLDCGLSDKPGLAKNWNVERFVQEVIDVLDHLGLEKCHILGHSWGGTILLELAAKHRDRIDTAIFLGPLISTEIWLADSKILRAKLDEKDHAILDTCEAKGDFTGEACESAVKTFYSRFLSIKGEDPRVADYEKANGIVYNDKQFEYMWGPTEFFATGILRYYDGTRILPSLKGLKTLFAGGEFDEARPESVAHFARLSGADSKVISGAAHDVFVDDPRLTMAILTEWLGLR